VDCEAITLRWAIAYHGERLRLDQIRLANITPQLQPEG
jgi:hypothetical protein